MQVDCIMKAKPTRLELDTFKIDPRKIVGPSHMPEKRNREIAFTKQLVCLSLS